MAMEYTFPIPTPYEIIDSSWLNLSSNLIYKFEQHLKNNENLFHQSSNQKHFYYFIIILFILSFLKNKIFKY